MLRCRHGFLVGLKKFDLEFELSERDGVELAAEPERARESVTITPWGVGSQRYFTYAATVPPMQVNLAPIERLAYYLGGQDGDRIGVSMTASLLDETFVDCRGAKLSKPKKQKVAEILAKKHAFGEPDEPGVVKLSQQALFLREEL